MKKTELGLFFVLFAAVLLIACGDPPPRNLNAPPPAPTSAPIANINANDLKKLRRSNENRGDLSSNEPGGMNLNSVANRAPGPKKDSLHEGEEKKEEDEDHSDKK